MKKQKDNVDQLWVSICILTHELITRNTYFDFVDVIVIVIALSTKNKQKQLLAILRSRVLA